MVCVVGAFAETTLTGAVKERKDNGAIPYATVSLLTQDSTLLTGAITDEKGNYTLSAAEGNYILKVSYVGYNTLCRNLAVTGKKQVVEDLFLTEETEELGEVQVQAETVEGEEGKEKKVVIMGNPSISANNVFRQHLRVGDTTVTGYKLEEVTRTTAVLTRNSERIELTLLTPSEAGNIARQRQNNNQNNNKNNNNNNNKNNQNNNNNRNNNNNNNRNQQNNNNNRNNNNARNNNNNARNNNNNNRNNNRDFEWF